MTAVGTVTGVEGATRSSFHSTINAVKALLEYEQRTGGTPKLWAVRKRGEEYLLQRRLRYRLSSGEQVGWWTDVVVYPWRWSFTLLKVIDHFTEAAAYDGMPCDERLTEQIERLRGKRQPDGRWLQEHVFPGDVWFPLDVAPGEPSKWITFIAQRALNRWDASN